ncbi:sugar phosphate isomerase/epimerase family protein [Xanthocytophaga agilis]|uniref:Sugar phosphate isomerase/epimerase family protein n=1 Tax=Xanthocytophaga agilis TaxID=3048010 RepID=A0AAE3R3I2_9BACT|nr:sugar phosphate isomerase/epimerase family protein [Xanthocytophaga agilis]MDJ1503171.1 sugar phosphate isomerase/epimerase family protein [Xanthocytophaga agilis]
MSLHRRDFLKQLGQASAAAAFLPVLGDAFAASPKKMFFEISLAEWSLHKAIFGKQLSNLDFPVKAKKDFGITIVEYVNTCFFDGTHTFKENATNQTYLKELLMRCKDNGVRNHLIMCDAEGNLGDLDDAKRKQAVENHYKWVEAAKYLGCATIRVNAAGEGTADEVAKAATDGLGRLSEFAAKSKINVIVENHGGYSSDGQWLSKVMKAVNMKNCGTLPDFGNFCLKWQANHAGCDESYDRYKGTEELMPFAKGVSAKTYNFDEKGNEKDMDYAKLLKIVKQAGFKGIVGIEYEGSTLTEEEGIRKTKALLERVGGTV